MRRNELVGSQYLLISNHVDAPARFIPGRLSAFPACRVADPDGRRNRLGFFNAMAEYDRRSSCRLKTEHLRQAGYHAVPVIFSVASPVSSNVSGIAHRQGMVVRCRAEIITHFK